MVVTEAASTHRDGRLQHLLQGLAGFVVSGDLLEPALGVPEQGKGEEGALVSRSVGSCRRFPVNTTVLTLGQDGVDEAQIENVSHDFSIGRRSAVFRHCALRRWRSRRRRGSWPVLPAALESVTRNFKSRTVWERDVFTK